MPTQGRKHLVDLVNRKGLGIKIVADPVEHFFEPFVVGVDEDLHTVHSPPGSSRHRRLSAWLSTRASSRGSHAPAAQWTGAGSQHDSDSRFSETKALQFRLESFNLTNRTNLGLPQTDVDVLNGATISTAKNPRQMQLGLRFEF